MKNQENSPWFPHGKALATYWNGDNESTIKIHMEDGSITSMPIAIYFRTEAEIPEVEALALDLCYGKVLDVGAGAGAHSLILQQKGIEVHSIDVDDEAIKIMNDRGLKNVYCVDFLHFKPKIKFDTLLFLMNGIGIAGNLIQLKDFLRYAQDLTSPKGQILLDSSDLRISNQLAENPNHYFGEITYQLSFNNLVGTKYQWLYVDAEELTTIAYECGWLSVIVLEEEDGSYLAQLSKLN